MSNTFGFAHKGPTGTSDIQRYRGREHIEDFNKSWKSPSQQIRISPESRHTKGFLSLSVHSITANTEEISEDETCDAISCNINLQAWAEALWVCLKGRWVSLGGGPGLNSLDALLALQQHLKRGPRHYADLPLLSLISRIHWRMEGSVYFAVVEKPTQPCSRRMVWLQNLRWRGLNNSSQRDPFVKLGHEWHGCLQLTSHRSCGCYMKQLEALPLLPLTLRLSHKTISDLATSVKTEHILQNLQWLIVVHTCYHSCQRW